MTRKVNDSYFTYKTMALFEKAGFVEIRHEVSSLEVRTEKNTDLLNGVVKLVWPSPRTEKRKFEPKWSASKLPCTRSESYSYC